MGRAKSQLYMLQLWCIGAENFGNFTPLTHHGARALTNLVHAHGVRPALCARPPLLGMMSSSLVIYVPGGLVARPEHRVSGFRGDGGALLGL